MKNMKYHSFSNSESVSVLEKKREAVEFSCHLAEILVIINVYD